jgi:hypothetical protein
MSLHLWSYDRGIWHLVDASYDGWMEVRRYPYCYLDSLLFCNLGRYHNTRFAQYCILHSMLLLFAVVLEANQPPVLKNYRVLFRFQVRLNLYR